MTNNLPVPYLRDSLLLANRPEPKNHKLGALLSIIVFGFFMLLAVIGRWFTGTNSAFMAGLLLAFGGSFITYKIATRISDSVSPKSLDQANTLFQPVFAKLNSAGMSPAVDHSRAILKIACMLEKKSREMFSIVDESLHFYLKKLLEIADARKVLGDERELKRALERAEFQASSRSQGEASGGPSEISQLHERLQRVQALEESVRRLTLEIGQLRNTCENHLVNRVTVQSEDVVLQLRESLDREQRVMAELERAGL